MAYWWVNHGQTFKVEITGGYIWSPFFNSNGNTNQSYLNLNRTSLNDVIFSHAAGRISAVGAVAKNAIESPKPVAYERHDNQWSQEGWLVQIKWLTLDQPLIPKNNLSSIVPLLPLRYSPIKTNGDGNLGNYLAAISDELGELLMELIRRENSQIDMRIFDLHIEIDEEKEIENVNANTSSPTHRNAIIAARVGQGPFKRAVERLENKCRLTDIMVKPFLIASHIKPWKDCSDIEKLDGHNGLLLAPHVDKLFDGGYISFTDEGEILSAHHLVNDVMALWELNFNKNVGTFTTKQKQYLNYHRQIVFTKRQSKMNMSRV